MLACDGFSGFLKVYGVYRWFSWISEGKGGPGLSLAVVRDLRDAHAPAGPDELAAFETDVLAGSSWPGRRPGCLITRSARTCCTWSSCGDGSAARCGTWSPRTPTSFLGRVLRDAAKGTRLARSQAPPGQYTGARQAHPEATPSAPVAMPYDLVPTLRQRFALARLRRPHLTASCAPFPHRSPRRSFSQHSMRWFDASPAGRRRRTLVVNSVGNPLARRGTPAGDLVF